jgi:nucleotide-binding universal stress UspA family protein
LTIGPSVAGRAKLPALQSRGRDLAPPELALRWILFATNYAPNGAEMAKKVVSLTAEFGAQLSLLHVIEDYSELGSRPGPIEDSIRPLKALIPADAALSFLPETLLEFGSPAEHILRVAADREVDMIILGARTAEEVGTTHLPGSTAHRVIAHAPCPVLTLRG